MGTARANANSRKIRWVAGPLLVAFGTTGCASLPFQLKASGDSLIAVDVVLEPESSAAGEANPAGAHLTLVRGFVKASDLESVTAVVGHVLATTRRDDLTITGTGDASPTLQRLDARIAESLRPFATDASTAKRFIVTPDRSRMSHATIEAVERFVPDASGVSYRPSLTADEAASTFKVGGAAIYQIGRLGAPERTLWKWTGENGARW